MVVLHERIVVKSSLTQSGATPEGLGTMVNTGFPLKKVLKFTDENWDTDPSFLHPLIRIETMSVRRISRVSELLFMV